MTPDPSIDPPRSESEWLQSSAPQLTKVRSEKLDAPSTAIASSPLLGAWSPLLSRAKERLLTASTVDRANERARYRSVSSFITYGRPGVVPSGTLTFGLPLVHTGLPGAEVTFP